MKLSVIIVNYNVKFFLEQCLHSVFHALKNIDSEVFVVDNNSVDGSVAVLHERFPNVILIKNEQNLGFSVANNMAIKQAKGEYILLLNPDTVVEEDTFIKTLEYLDSHPEAGALGVKMIDGKGNYLPESKRGLPTPWVAFYKIFGLSKIFPKSQKFGKYHLSYLDSNTVQEIDVLCGAFMLMRKKVLDEAGLLDESFFMYGEDIDLSYRIQKYGYKVIYFPETTIIHYKGESTKKSSLNYVFLFYKAMQIFAGKHLSGGGAWWLNVVIQIAIYLRASLAALKRIMLKTALPTFDILLIYTGIVILAKSWGTFWFKDPNYYPAEFYNSFLPAYLVIWIVSLFFSGGYDYPVKLRNNVSGIAAGTLIILIVYALLPQQYHYSRVIIIFGSVLALLLAITSRLILSLTKVKQFKLQNRQRKNILIIGNHSECERVSSILKKINIPTAFLAFVSPDRNLVSNHYIGNIEQIREMVSIQKINEVIFCSHDLQASTIINTMLNLTELECDFKIAPSGSETIIGSNSINTAGDLYVYNVNNVTSPKNTRLKRTFDLFISILIILLFPVWIWFRKKPGELIINAFKVLFNQKTWIGYSLPLKGTKSAVFDIRTAFPESKNNSEFVQKLELAYTQNYRMINDFKIIVKAFLSTN